MLTEQQLVPGYFSLPCGLPNGANAATCSLKMCRDCSPLTEGKILILWLEKWLGVISVHQKVDGKTPAVLSAPEVSSNGACWTRNGSEFRSGASVSSLSEILETGSVDPRYFLTAKACAGILRRAEKRGKALPPMLHQALQAVAGASSEPEKAAAKTPVIAQPFDVANCLTRRMHKGINSTVDEGRTPIVTHSLRAEHDASEDGTGRGTPLVPVAIPLDMRNASQDPEKKDEMNRQGCGVGSEVDPAPTVSCAHVNAVAFSETGPGSISEGIGTIRAEGENRPSRPTHTILTAAFSGGNSNESRGIGYTEEGTPPLRAGASGTNQVPTMCRGMSVRRLTPKECARLQGFPDDYLDITYRGKPAADGPKYKALGNSMAVPCMAWIGRRIQMVEDLTERAT